MHGMARHTTYVRRGKAGLRPVQTLVIRDPRGELCQGSEAVLERSLFIRLEHHKQL